MKRNKHFLVLFVPLLERQVKRQTSFQDGGRLRHGRCAGAFKLIVALIDAHGLLCNELVNK